MGTYGAAFYALYSANPLAGTYTYNGTSWSLVLPYTDPQYFTYSVISGGTAVSIDDYNVGGGLDVIIPPELGGLPVTTIGWGAFTSKNMTSVVLPESLQTIAEQGFYDNSITSITLPSNTTSVGIDAFYGCQITSITLGMNVGISADSMGTYGGSFYSLYNSNPLAGTYSYSGGNWAKTA